MTDPAREREEAPARERFTAYPRPVLWLVPEGDPPAPVEGAHGAHPPGPIAPFYLSTLPVTNRQLEAWNPSFQRSPLAPGDDDPAVGIGYEEALGYCAWYSRVSRKPIRLPTEAEWEHACRGGGRQPWPLGPGAARSGDLVWHRGNSGESIPPLAAKGSNPFGLYAMLGGVWEWVVSASGEPVLRGGSWRTPLAEIAAGARLVVEPGARPADAGFRIAKSLRG